MDEMRQRFITNCDGLFITKNATILLQIAIVVTKCDDVITYCDSTVASMHTKSRINEDFIISKKYVYFRIYFNRRNFRERNFRDFRKFWANSRKFISRQTQNLLFVTVYPREIFHKSLIRESLSSSFFSIFSHFLIVFCCLFSGR